MNIRLWGAIHQWSSLVCTAFLLMLCVTGLPLIFHDEIDDLLGEINTPEMTNAAPDLRLDVISEAAHIQRPNEVIRVMAWDQEDSPNITFVSMASHMNAPQAAGRILKIDSKTAKILENNQQGNGFMKVIFKLHVNMLVGLSGMYFLGAMGFTFVISILSGALIYYPFMRRLEFGAIRSNRHTRLKWLDLHNLLGILLFTWTLIVGLTGVINTLSPVIVSIWQKDQMAEMIAPYKDAPLPKHQVSVQMAIDKAKTSFKAMNVGFVAYPGSLLSSPHHYTIFMKGDTKLTSKLLRPVLIDAETGVVTASREMPWYAKLLFLSQPLHFGDYGGLALKIIWALLDIVTMIVLMSGLYLWWDKRKLRLRPA